MVLNETNRWCNFRSHLLRTSSPYVVPVVSVGPKQQMLYILTAHVVNIQWRIQDFPQDGEPTPKIAIIFQIFAENCVKMKEFGPPGGRASLAAPLGSANDIKSESSIKKIFQGQIWDSVEGRAPTIQRGADQWQIQEGGCSRCAPPTDQNFLNFM